eukprot:scaffold24973_cov117-Isochrysis_galbana.AAC.4
MAEDDPSIQEDEAITQEKQQKLPQDTNAKQTDHWNLIFTQALHKPRGPRAPPHSKKGDEPTAHTRTHASPPPANTFDSNVNSLYPTSLQLSKCIHTTTLLDQWRTSAPGHRPPSTNITLEISRLQCGGEDTSSAKHNGFSL